jgi:hypothetical protein
LRSRADPKDLLKCSIYIQGVRPWEIEEYYEQMTPILNQSFATIVGIVKGFTGSKYGLIFEDLEKIHKINPARFAVLVGRELPRADSRTQTRWVRARGDQHFTRQRPHRLLHDGLCVHAPGCEPL